MSYEHTASDHIEQLRYTVQDAAERLAPAITLYGLRDPHTLDIDPEEYSRVLDTRLQVEWAIANQHRQDGGDLGAWSFAKGLYNRYGDGWDCDAPIGKQPLVSDELIVAENVDRLLEGRPNGEPVVVLDFGGGLGMSWMRIASKPKYSTAIEEGQLVMVVSNLGSVPDKSPDSEGYSGIARNMNSTNKLERENRFRTSFSNEDLQWVQQNQNRVQYFDANALELADMSMHLPDGTQLPVIGNVDVIYERLALEHTHVPDLALASFSELLSNQGTLYSNVATYYHIMHPSQSSEVPLENGEVVRMTDEYYNQRRLALAIGSKMLLLHGFSYRLDEQNHKGVFSRLPDTVQ